jgi:type IV secretion system protein VirD4
MQSDDRAVRAFCLFGIFPVIWLGLLIAPGVSAGLPSIAVQFSSAMQNPFCFTLCEDSLKTVLAFLCTYGLGIGVYFSSRHNYRKGEEHGSARWGNARTVNRKYRDKRDPLANRIFTQHVRMGLDGRTHRRNLNTLVVGGSGAGKSRFYALVNLLQANTSFFVLDCKGELLRTTGALLKKRGYDGNKFIQSHHAQRQPVARPLLGHSSLHAVVGTGVLSPL